MGSDSSLFGSCGGRSHNLSCDLIDAAMPASVGGLFGSRCPSTTANMHTSEWTFVSNEAVTQGQGGRKAICFPLLMPASNSEAATQGQRVVVMGRFIYVPMTSIHHGQHPPWPASTTRGGGKGVLYLCSLTED
jgi:hypothetical protein